MAFTGRIFWGWLGILALVYPGAGRVLGADDLGGISVSAAAIYTGTTVHGYAETRVLLENNSAKTHIVTLSSPNRAYNAGNSVSQVSRTVTVPPGVQVVVSLLQPPLPSNGDSLIRVAVDGREEGTTRLPNANNHCTYYNRGISMAGAAFLSRSVDADAMGRMLNRNHIMYSAAMATGEPDNWSGGVPTKMWMPDTSAFGNTNWLELNYGKAIKAYHLEIHWTQPPQPTGLVELIGASGTNVATLNLATASLSGPPRASGARQWIQELSFPTTREPVKTIRLDFGVTPSANIAISAVSLDDGSGEHFADTARASSENTAAAPSVTAFRGGTRFEADTIRCLRAESALSDWSDNWLAYSPFDVVVLGATDLAAMPAPVAAAIGDYLQAGGNVVILGAKSLPAQWNPGPTSGLPDGIRATSGFGDIFVMGTTDSARWDTQTVHQLRDAITATARYWQVLPADSGEANTKLPVVENLKIPARGITVITLLFIAAVGPVNIFLLARKNRRIWMLWTIPAISLVTTLLIFAYSLEREGITPNMRMAGLTILDQPGHHAATCGAMGFYCPLTPSDGLRFDNETEATPLVSMENYSSGSAREVDWTQSQHFRHGWVTSRVPAQFHIRKSEVRRERLEWQKVKGGWQIINGLGAPIKSLWLADQDLNFYAIEGVPAGQPAMLLPVRSPPSPARLGATVLFAHQGYCMQSPGPEVLNYLEPGTYIAVLDGNPFMENALGAAASAKRTQSTAVVYGRLDPPATP